MECNQIIVLGDWACAALAMRPNAAIAVNSFIVITYAAPILASLLAAELTRSARLSDTKRPYQLPLSVAVVHQRLPANIARIDENDFSSCFPATAFGAHNLGIGG